MVEVPARRGHRGGPVPWHRDPVILARLEIVARESNQGYSIYRISANTGIPYQTVQADLKRLDTIWRAQVGKHLETLRGQAVRKLNHVYTRAMDAIAYDEEMVEAVTFDRPIVRQCPGGVVHRLGQPVNPADPTQPPPRRRQPRHQQPNGEAADNDSAQQPRPEAPEYQRLYDQRDVADMLLEEVFGGPEFGNPGEACPGPHLVQYRIWRDANGKAEYRHSIGTHLQVARQALMDQAKLLGLVIDRKQVNDSGTDTLAGYLAQLLEQAPPPTVLDATVSAPPLPAIAEEEEEEPEDPLAYLA